MNVTASRSDQVQVTLVKNGNLWLSRAEHPALPVARLTSGDY